MASLDEEGNILQAATTTEVRAGETCADPRLAGIDQESLPAGHGGPGLGGGSRLREAESGERVLVSERSRGFGGGVDGAPAAS